MILTYIIVSDSKIFGQKQSRENKSAKRTYPTVDIDYAYPSNYNDFHIYFN